MNYFKKNILGILLLIIGLYAQASENNKQLVVKTQSDSIIIAPNNAVTLNSKNPYQKLSNVNSKDTYYLTPSEWSSKIKTPLKGVINKHKQYVFINLDPAGKLSDNSFAIYNLHRLGISESTFQNSNYEPKFALAYYEKLLSNSMPLIFGLASKRNIYDSDIYIIFPSLYSSTTENDTQNARFFCPNYYSNKSTVKLSVKQLSDLHFSYTTNKLLKGNLYIPTIKDTAHFCAYAFLYYANTTQNRKSDNLIIGYVQAGQPFYVVHTFSSELVIQQLKKHFLKNAVVSEASDDLKNLLYEFLNSQKNEPDNIKIAKKSIEDDKDSCEINITDTQCFETEKTLETTLFVKICLQTKITGFIEKINITPIYAIFKTSFPLDVHTTKLMEEKKYLDLDWNVKFFQFLDSSNTAIDIKQDLYLKPHAKEMPSNDVRPIKIVDEKDSENSSQNSPVPSFIKNITDDGIEYVNCSTLQQIEYQTNKTLALSNSSENNDVQNKTMTVASQDIYQSRVYIQPTELLRTFLNNIINPTPNKREKQRSGKKQNSADNLLLFAQSLIAQNEVLQNNVQRLSEQVNDLSLQHNGFFKLGKTLDDQQKILDTQEKEIKKAVDTMNRIKNSITEEQEKFVHNATATLAKDLETKNKELMQKTQQTQLAEFNALKDELKKAIEDQTQTMKNLQDEFTQQSEEMFKEKENKINQKSQDLDKKVSDVEQLLASNQENLAKLQDFNDQLTIMQNTFNDVINKQIPDINHKIKNISEIRLSDLQPQNDYNTSNNEKISNLQNRNFYLTCGLIGSGTITVGLFIFLCWYIHQIQTRIALLEVRLM